MSRPVMGSLRRSGGCAFLVAGLHLGLAVLSVAEVEPGVDRAADAGEEAKPKAEAGAAEAAVRALGGHVFRHVESGKVVEVKLDRSAVTDGDLAGLAFFPDLTDLSLEETGITGAGLAHLSSLKKLEWLNLWQTRVDDAGLAHLAGLRRLEFLPIGNTRVTDAGLKHLRKIRSLSYGFAKQ